MGIQLFKAKYEIDECLEEIRECLEVGWTGLGFKTVEFEERWKEYTSLPNAHFVNSATAGLYMVVDILKNEYGWEDGDEVISTPLSFVSTNHAILKSGLKPVFADIDDTFCLDPDSVADRITDRTRAVMYVGMGGNSGRYHDIVNICKEHGLNLILDAAHMAGTRINGVIPGSEADAVVYSFQAVKNLPTADSGMVCFKENRFDEIVRKKSWLGINKDTYSRTYSSGNYKWKYDVEYVGEKAHGNSVMAAIGIVQLRYLDRDNEYRRKLCEWYKENLSIDDGKIGFVRIPDECESSCHLFQVIVENRDDVMVELNKADIYPGVHYECNTNYRMYEYAKGSCPHADYVGKHVISLPLNLYLTNEDVKYISDNLIKIVEK